MRVLLADGFVVEVISACADEDKNGKYVLCLERPGGDEFLLEYEDMSIREASYRTKALIRDLFMLGYADFSSEPIKMLPKEGEKDE